MPNAVETVRTTGDSFSPVDIYDRSRFDEPDAPLRDWDHAVRAAMIEACGGFSPFSLSRAWMDWAVHLAGSPGRRIELIKFACDEGAKAASDALSALSGQATAINAPAHDKRFQHEAWRRLPFRLWAQSFLASEAWWRQATQDVHGADPHSLRLVEFVARQALDSVAPTNFLATNPVALAKTRGAGANLIRGASNFWRDLARARRGERPEAAAAWVPGKTVALTPGAVVKRTRLAEVIQYRPLSDRVRPEPVVIAPAWIMKYYVLDLRPENSLIKALTEAGFTVFAISWRNPTAEDRETGFEDYGAEGLQAALSAALAITGASRAHLVGYCIGGALAAVAAAAMSRDHDDRLASLTLLAAQVDYTEAGELRLFVDASQIGAIEDLMWEEGGFEGFRMAGAFDLLRSNDLIWSRIVHHYLMGEPEAMNDISAWSTDATRLPYVMHRDYLRDFYLNNAFAEGRLSYGGRPASPRDIRVPIFALGAQTDHVAPWRSVFKIHQFTDADVTFALTSGGHNRGVVAPPGSPGCHFHLATTRASEARPDPDAWLRAATQREGSWWTAWFDWLRAHSGDPVSAPPLGRAEEGFAPLGDAPGTYVLA